MKILVGITPDASASDAMALAAVLQRRFGAQVVLANIFAAPDDPAGRRKVDAEWVDYMRREAVDVLTEAASDAASRYGLEEYTIAVHGHRSSGVGLIELAEAVSATTIVIGSAPGSPNGRFMIGSTADQLLHGSHVPVALATTGYRRVRPETLGRLVVAFQDTHESHTALRWAAAPRRRPADHGPDRAGASPHHGKSAGLRHRGSGHPSVARGRAGGARPRPDRSRPDG